MPEGDTIHRAAATLARALTGRTVTRFETAYAQLAAVDDQSPIAGRAIERIWAEGKHLLIRFSGALTLRTHMRMNGSWHIYRVGEPWKAPRRDLRILIESTAPPPASLPTSASSPLPPGKGPPSAGLATSASSPLPPGGPPGERPTGTARRVRGRSPTIPAAPPLESFVAVAFSVPVAEFLDDRALARSPTLRRLGPDLLGPTFDPAIARQRARAKPDQPMSEIPLDQSIAAGAGNVYRSEVLFLSGINPAAPLSAITDDRLDALFALTRKLLLANVATGTTAGSTGQIVTYTGLRRTTGRSDPGERLWVYGRGGKPCRRCGTRITFSKTGPDARVLYHCPHCQR